MANPKFLKPSEIKKRDERTTVSARVKTTTFDYLEKAAEGDDLTLSHLIANILDQYVDWLDDSKNSQRKARG